MMEISTGAHLGPYEIVGRVGAGGMGEVYRARDQRLERDVAIKVLPGDLSLDKKALTRFRREAKALAALSHPNILTIHDIGEQDGQVYVVMELLEGQTLRQRILCSPLSWQRAVEIITAVCEGLEAAHSHGIIHRDLKPENIFITADERVKILDFGLAKRLDSQDLQSHSEMTTESQATAYGTILGTVPYMSPEQARGESLGPQSDIFSTGTILYELLTGKMPFAGPNIAASIYKILHENLPPASTMVSDLPGWVDQVTQRALAKNREDRYSSAAAMLSDLKKHQYILPTRELGKQRLRPVPGSLRRRLVVGTIAIAVAALLVVFDVGGLRSRFIRRAGTTRITSLAVLPLENLSGDEEQEYFADGMTEELITNLAKISSLKVISRTSVMTYKGTKKPLPQIARELQVDALIEGSVLREGGQVRITAQLIQAATDQHLWAESYTRDLRGVLALQGEIASAIADKVRAALTPAERASLASARPVNPEAYDACLKGDEHNSRLTPQEIETAIEYYELALKKDPNCALAYAGIAVAWLGRNQMGYTAPHEGGPKAKAAALKAIELDDKLAQAHGGLAAVKWLYEWDWAGAEEEFKRAIELNPSNADPRTDYSHFLMIMKRPDEAMAQIQRALALDPLNAVIKAFSAVDLEFVSRQDDAIVRFREALRMSPELPFAHWMLAGILFRKGMYAESLAELKAYYTEDREIAEALTQGYAQSGYPGAMRRAADTLAARARQTYSLPTDVAQLYAWAGEDAQALDWLERGFEARDPNMPYVSVDPTYDTLRSTPRFQAILRSMKLPQ